MLQVTIEQKDGKSFIVSRLPFDPKPNGGKSLTIGKVPMTWPTPEFKLPNGEVVLLSTSVNHYVIGYKGAYGDCTQQKARA